MNTTRRRFWAAVLAMFGMAGLMYVPNMGWTQDGKTPGPKKSADQGQSQPQSQSKGLPKAGSG